jgi:hypothetical protein
VVTTHFIPILLILRLYALNASNERHRESQSTLLNAESRSEKSGSERAVSEVQA